MARQKSQQQELFDMLRARGLRKRVAKTVADAAGKGDGRLPKQARAVLDQLQALPGEVERRVTGGSKQRSEAAKKAARTRQRNAKKRSDAAKKGARTRSKASAR